MNGNKYIDGLAYDLLSYYWFKTITSGQLFGMLILELQTLQEA